MNKNPDPIDRFMDKVFKHSNGCWIWLGDTGDSGYGRFRVGRKMVSAHRWIYEEIFGSLGELDCCHSCDNTSCVNPSHLFSGTTLENIMDCVNKGRHKAASKTHCPKGHEYSPENTRFDIKTRRRHCRSCDRERRQIQPQIYERVTKN